MPPVVAKTSGVKEPYPYYFLCLFMASIQAGAPSLYRRHEQAKKIVGCWIDGNFVRLGEKPSHKKNAHC